MKKIIVPLFAFIVTACFSCANAQQPQQKYAAEKTDAEWKKLLSANAYNITRQEGTEPPYTGKYWDNHEKGIYYCVDCGKPLFSSDTKFESHTGWPSFYSPIKNATVGERSDNSLGMERTEVICTNCGAHLGHVFNDGPKPTGLRYCMNSGALTFKKSS